MIRIRTNILNPITSSLTEYLQDYVIEVENGIIQSIELYNSQKDCLDYREYICCPGYIDIHVHLSQYRIQGSYRPDLIDWLNTYVFPEEARSINADYAQFLADDFFQALIKNGTTYAVIYTAPYKVACEKAFETAYRYGYKAKIGMTLMDQNCPIALQQNTSQALDECRSMIKEYHNPTDHLEYILTPRFAPTCSNVLMQQVSDLAKFENVWIQTHLSENKNELQWVKDLYGMDSYTDVYNAFGILSNHTILAHCIHLNDKEFGLLKDSGSVIAHCPDSNFFLKSGAMNINKIDELGIPFALGSDVGAGTSLNMLYHAKMMIYRQDHYLVSPLYAFYQLTLGAANTIGKESVIGSINVGKIADMVFYECNSIKELTSEEIIAKLIFTSENRLPDLVMMNGQFINQ